MGWVGLNTICACADSDSFIRGSPTLTTIFLVDEGIQIPLIAGQHWPTSKTPFKWGFADMPMIDGPLVSAGLVALKSRSVLLRNAIFL